MAVFLLWVILFTGLLEMFYYVPSPEEAAQSVQTITYLVPFGWFIRNLHFWSAQLLLIVVIVHLLRVIFTGAYLPPRRFNYLLGSGLLVLCILLNFSGYVLRWDSGVHWALITGVNLLKTIPLLGQNLYTWVLGGDQPGSPALIRFYTWHIAGLTMILIGGSVWHLFRVRRDGGIAVPAPELRTDSQRISRFELVRREVLAMILLSTLLIGLAIGFPAPIAAPLQDNINAGEATVRAPWFFLWVQQLLKSGDPFCLGILVPLMGLLLIGLIPFLPVKHAETGRWFPKSGRTAQFIASAIFLAVVILTLWAVAS